MRVLAVDPGSKTSGLVVRDGQSCLHVELVERGSAFEEYFEQVIDAAMAASKSHNPDVHAVEGVVAPSPHLGLIDVGPLLEIAEMVGALRNFGFVVVRPRGHGRPPELPLAALKVYMEASYPAELLGERETTYGGAKRHLRSAWDVAASAVEQTRQQSMFGGA